MLRDYGTGVSGRRSVLTVFPLRGAGRPAAEISFLYVPPPARGRGHAKSMLGTLCRDADLDGTALRAVAAVTAGMDQARLLALYAGFGFAAAGADDGAPVLWREPGRADRAASS